MKIALPTNKKRGTLEDEVALHFGRAKNYLIYDTETKTFDVYPNPEVAGGKLLPPDFLNQKGANMVIVFGLGFKAYEKFKNYNIKMYKALHGTIAKNISVFEQNKLQKLTREDVF